MHTSGCTMSGHLLSVHGAELSSTKPNQSTFSRHTWNGSASISCRRRLVLSHRTVLDVVSTCRKPTRRRWLSTLLTPIQLSTISVATARKPLPTTPWPGSIRKTLGTVRRKTLCGSVRRAMWCSRNALERKCSYTLWSIWRQWSRRCGIVQSVQGWWTSHLTLLFTCASTIPS